MTQIYFSTFAVQNWVSIFRDIPESNSVILNSLCHISKNDEVEIYAFVIMRDHIHIVWKMDVDIIDAVSIKFKRFTGCEIVKLMKSFNSSYLENFTSEKVNREYKFWKARSGSLALQQPSIVW